MPKISIIVPMYKVEKYIYRCVDSILKQSMNDIEVILVNDGSPDRCGEIAEEYAAKDKRIKVIHQKNMGLSSARNAGLQHVNGSFISFIDPDDWIEEDMYEKMYCAAIKHGCEIVICDIDTITGVTSEIKGYSFGTEQPLNKDLILKDIMPILFESHHLASACNKLYSTNLIINNNIKFPSIYSEDLPFNIDAFLAADKVIYLPYAFYHYVMRSDSICRENRKKIFELSMDLYNIKKKYLQNINIYKSVYVEKNSKYLVSFALKSIIEVFGLRNPTNFFERMRRISYITNHPELQNSLRFVKSNEFKNNKLMYLMHIFLRRRFVPLLILGSISKNYYRLLKSIINSGILKKKLTIQN